MEEEEVISDLETSENSEKIDQNQFFDLITGEELSWQAIIYDLVKTEQLDPWDIEIGILAEKYIETIEQLEEADFFISSKVLLACSLLLRLKSEILSNSYIQSLDEALYGRKEDKKYELERIEIDEDELPILVPRTPMARYKKVTLNELMSALNQAIETENRRIKKEIRKSQAEKATATVLPNKFRISLKDRITTIYDSIKNAINHPEKMEMPYSELAPSKEERLAAFLPVLHLTNEEKVYLKQEQHFEEIWMRLDKIKEELEDLEKEIEEEGE
jgi:segregation and condensation protein A